MTLWLLRLATGWSFALVAPAVVADIGSPVASARAGPFEIQVLVSPAPFRAGLSEWNVLVSDAHEGRALLDAEVELELHAPRAGMGHHHGPVVAHPRGENSKNRLFHSALLDLPMPGIWRGTLTVRRAASRAEIPIVISLAPAPSAVKFHWRAFALPPVALALFALHQLLSRHARRR